MKKALGGCLAVSVVLLLVGGIALWFLVLKPAAQVADRALDDARESIAQVADFGRTAARMREIEVGVSTSGPYAAPADGRLAPAQVERFLVVHAAVVAGLGPATLAQDAAASADGAGALRALTRRLGSVGIDTKQAQVDALNAQTMSLDEYRWIRERAVEALVAGGVSLAATEAGTKSGEALGRAAEVAQRFGEAARQATDAAAVAADAARRASEAARNALQGAPAPADPSVEPPAPAAAPAVDDTPASPPPAVAGASDSRLANFALVQPHAEAFIRAKALAVVGL